MKVCTDASLFGAYVAGILEKFEAKNILDIGTGTGLLSLMLAQKNDGANIHAIELDESAAIQAKQNFENSPWKERLQVFHISLQHFIAAVKYDLIICNPPFFQNDLKSSDPSRNTALHGIYLNFDELILGIEKNLANNGIFAVLLPFQRSIEFEKKANASGFFLHEKIYVAQNQTKPFFRSIMLFGKNYSALSLEELSIKNSENEYSAEFAKLLEDYYLFL